MWRKYSSEEILCVIECGRAFVEGVEREHAGGKTENVQT
jgi:hypothetical protein